MCIYIHMMKSMCVHFNRFSTTPSSKTQVPRVPKWYFKSPAGSEKKRYSTNPKLENKYTPDD